MVNQFIQQQYIDQSGQWSVVIQKKIKGMVRASIAFGGQLWLFITMILVHIVGIVDGKRDRIPKYSLAWSNIQEPIESRRFPISKVSNV